MSLPQINKKLDTLGSAGYPTCATLELTYRCNASCEYCYVEPREKDELPTEAWIEILEKLNQNGILGVVFTGGEIFTRKDILDILDKAIQCGFFDIILFTNGTLITGEQFDYFRTNCKYFSMVQMSAFSHKSAIHDSYMGVSGALDKIMTAGTRLQKNGIPVVLSMPGLDINVGELPDSIKFFNSAGFSNVRSTPLKLIPTEEVRHKLKGSQTKENYIDFLAQYTSEEKRMIALEWRNMYDEKNGRGVCRGITNSININPTGKITPCPTFHNIEYGSIFQRGTIHDIITSSSLYKKLIENTDIYAPECTNCKLTGLCQQCAAKNLMETGSFHCLNPEQCNFTKCVYAAMIQIEQEHSR